jgi:hypothetical protein
VARASDALVNARVAALADPDGDRLSKLLDEFAGVSEYRTLEPATS